MMHETLSKNFIGQIDSIKKTDKHYHIVGWVVPLITADSCYIGCEGFLSITPSERKDVYSYYKESHLNFLRSGFNIILDPKTEDVVIHVNGETVFKVQVEVMESVLQPNEYTKPELIVVDNFYKDVDAVRAYALKQEFVAKKDYHKGRRTIKSFIPHWIQGSFEKALSRPIREFTGATGVFQYCVAEDQVVYHYDMQEYAAMIYLSPDAPLNTGTSTYKSKHTGLMHAATEEDAQKFGKSVSEINAQSFNGNSFYDKTNMELVDSVANVYNRMVIFNARALHAATSYYGTTKENARLFHLFFFNC